MPIEFSHPYLNWKVLYRESGICGPAQIWIGDRQILSFNHCLYDGLEDRDMVLDKKRFYRKGGARIHFASGHFANGNSITQTAKFSGNSCRITTDVKWCSGNVLKNSFDIGSFVLPGVWKRYFNVTDMKWHDLPASGTIELPPETTALVFEDEKENQLEAGLGDDLWRWANGFAPEGENRGKFTIDIQPNKIVVTRAVTVNDKAEPIIPTPRFYRFCSYFAWYAPCFTTTEAAPHWDNNAIKISLEPSCWEGRTIQNAFRTAIRKASEDNNCHNVIIESGMSRPSICSDGKHCNHKNEVKHWDICAILDAVSWAIQTLGNGRNIIVNTDENWAALPSFGGLGLPNGFSNDDVINQGQ